MARQLNMASARSASTTRHLTPFRHRYTSSLKMSQTCPNYKMAHGKLYIQLMNSREWRKTRARKMQANPICERCLALHGRVVAARCIHHLVPVESGRTEQECREICFRLSNLQSLCYKCHSDIHQAERYQSKEARKQRDADRLEQWKDIMEKKFTPSP